MRRKGSRNVSVHFVCPHCGIESEVADRFVGQTGPCAHCGVQITVPQFASGGGIRTQSSTKTVLIVLSVVGVLAVLFIGLMVVPMFPAIGGTRESARRICCNNQLKKISYAMHAYHDKYKCFPPAYIADKNGRPMHSWRVLLLPYLEQEALYKQYRFDEPWDSPNNQKVTDLILCIYQCPSQPDSTKPMTSYVMIVGPHTVSDGPHSRKLTDFTDGLSNSILLVEVADSDIRWAEPRDLNFDKINFKINGSKGQSNSGKHRGIGSHHINGVNVSLCDGSVRFLNGSMDPKQIKAMATIDGGETVPADDF
jgi:prepilin-type processing-associated H-X9-DG protein